MPGVDQGGVTDEPAELDPDAGHRRTCPGPLEERERRAQRCLVAMGQAARSIELGLDQPGLGQDRGGERLEGRIGQRRTPRS